MAFSKKCSRARGRMFFAYSRMIKAGCKKASWENWDRCEAPIRAYVRANAEWQNACPDDPTRLGGAKARKR